MGLHPLEKRRALARRHTQPDVRAPRQELWYPPSNAMDGFNEAAALKGHCCRAERPRVLRLHTDLKIALPRYRGDQRREADFDLIVYGATGYTGRLIAISGDVLSRRRCSVLGDRGTLDDKLQKVRADIAHQTIWPW